MVLPPLVLPPLSLLATLDGVTSGIAALGAALDASALVVVVDMSLAVLRLLVDLIHPPSKLVISPAL